MKPFWTLSSAVTVVRGDLNLGFVIGADPEEERPDGAGGDEEGAEGRPAFAGQEEGRVARRRRRRSGEGENRPRGDFEPGERSRSADCIAYVQTTE